MTADMQNVLIVQQLAHIQAQQPQDDQFIVTILNPLTAGAAYIRVLFFY